MSDNEWVLAEERIPNVFSGKFQVRLQNGDEINAFFYQDAMAWIAFYGQKTSHWWNAKYPYEPIFDVTYWKGIIKRNF